MQLHLWVLLFSHTLPGRGLAVLWTGFDTVAYDPDTLHFIDETEEMMKKCTIGLFSKIITFLIFAVFFIPLTGVLHRIGVKTQEEFKRDVGRVCKICGGSGYLLR